MNPAATTSAPWQLALDTTIDELVPRLVELRRHLHAHPELSGCETETTEHLAGLLRYAGIEPRLGPGNRGLVVEAPLAPSAAQTKRVAMRADIDALPIQEVDGRTYGSRCPGRMHACGHDGHASTLLGAVLALHALEKQSAFPWPVPWRAIFQPAEETLMGAREMIAAGFVEDVAGIFSLHMDPSRAVGSVGMRVGAFTAHCDSLNITITGQGGHAARPHQTRDPIAAGVMLISNLYQAIPRAVDSQDAVVLSFGQFIAGDAANVIPDHALVRGTLRTLDRKVREQALEQIRRVAAGVAEATRTEITVDRTGGIESVVNDPALTDVARTAAIEVVGRQHVVEMARPSMGSEDFAAYLDLVPGNMFRLGCASETAGSSALHTPTFDLDERCLAIGAKILARSCVLWSDPRGLASRS
jgi:amidohydrolase